MGVPGPIGDIQPFVELATRPSTVVYKAYQRSLDRVVLLKVLQPTVEGDEGLSRRFADEARLVARVQHRNVVAVYDFGEYEGRTHIVSEYVEGTDLAAVIAASRFPPELALYVAHEVANGLDAAHRKGVLHRDVKPANILVSMDGEVKLADFGMASLLTEDAQRSEVRGTLPYLSPEQLRGESASERSDLFALGATLFEMLSGRPAFQAAERSELIDAIMHFDPVPLLDADRRIEPRVRHLVAKLLEKDPDQRYRSAGVLVRDVARLREAATFSAGEDALKSFVEAPAAYSSAPDQAPASLPSLPDTHDVSPASPAAAPASPAAAPAAPARKGKLSRVAFGMTAAAIVILAGYLAFGRPGGGSDDSPQAGAFQRVENERLDGVEEGEAPVAMDHDAPEDGNTLADGRSGAARSADEVQVGVETSSGVTESPAAASSPTDADGPPVTADEPLASADEPLASAGDPPAPVRLRIGVSPWAEVSVDGQVIGSGPAHDLSLAPGVYEIRLENPSFPAHTREVELEAGVPQRVFISLWEMVGRIHVQAVPWAAVSIDGEPADTLWGPGSFIVPPGRHTLTLANSALGVARDTTVSVDAGAELTLRMDLTDGR